MISEDLNDIDYRNIIIYDPIKNSIIQQSNFYKIIYSNSLISYNGIYGLFKLKDSYVHQERCNFKIELNNETINKIINLEKYLLNIFDIKKFKIYKLAEILKLGYIKYNSNILHDDVYNKLISYKDNKQSLFNSNSNSNSNSNYLTENTFTENTFILKISGIWETKENMGLTFKIILTKNNLAFF
jgi:hypothetical protein